MSLTDGALPMSTSCPSPAHRRPTESRLAAQADLIRLEDVCHSYTLGTSGQSVVRDVCFALPAGQSCALVGASGSGKSTLLNLIGLLDRPTSGRVLLAGQDMTDADAATRAMDRNRTLGFVFQSFNLLPRLDALDNVALPLLYRGWPQCHAREAARAQLARVGLSERTHHRPDELSGGQRQRTAIARALVGEPALLLADEPTGNLDGQTARSVLELLLALNRERGTTLLVVTHDDRIAQRLDRCLQVRDGRLEELRHG